MTGYSFLSELSLIGMLIKCSFIVTQEWNTPFHNKDVVLSKGITIKDNLFLPDRSGVLNCSVMTNPLTFLSSNKEFTSRTFQFAMAQETGCLISLRQNKPPHVSLSD